MKTLALTPETLGAWGRTLLRAGFGFGLLILVFLTWNAPELLPFFPALLLGLIGLFWIAQSETRLLYFVLAAFALIARYKEGFQVEEILYGLLYLGFLGYWFTSRLFFYRDRIFTTTIDWALGLFLLYTIASTGLTILFGGDLQVMLSEWLSLSMLAFYFPVKEVCARYPEALKRLLIVLAWLGLFVALRNFYEYWLGFTGATHLWQIASGRVTENEHVLMMLGLATLILLLHVKRLRHKVAFLLLFGFFMAGVVIGQSRALWVSFALGVIIIFLLIDRGKKVQLILITTSGIIFLIILGILFFNDFFSLIVLGLINRLGTLETAATSDISLINRFVEMKVVWDYILRNPVLGYGLGVPYHYYSLVYELTHETSFIHNGYLGALYRHGLIGSSLLFVYFFGTLWQGFRVWRHSELPLLARLTGLIVVGAFLAEALVANTENPFTNSDRTLMIGVLSGLVAGIRARYHSVPSRPQGDA
ncbi:O-antigen ligase family protein [Rhodocaloribacter sp.]